ncbi:MAG: RNA polymerase sigma factor RpoE [Pseudomonadales bacterium]|nr:RNA polymerase sigma factor RpoE [Pseudomonadales bacterium]
MQQQAPRVDADQQLVERVQKGDKQAFDMLVIKYQSRVMSLVLRLVRDHHEAQDIVQEAFIKAYRALPRFRGDSAFYTWLYRIAVNTAKNYLVSKGRRPAIEGVELDEAEVVGIPKLQDIDSPERQLLRDELEQVIYGAINSLPSDLKTAITLREFEGLSYEEIANIMDCPVGTVRSRIFRAREAIDKQIVRLRAGDPVAAE